MNDQPIYEDLVRLYGDPLPPAAPTEPAGVGPDGEPIEAEPD